MANDSIYNADDFSWDPTISQVAGIVIYADPPDLRPWIGRPLRWLGKWLNSPLFRRWASQPPQWISGTQLSSQPAGDLTIEWNAAGFAKVSEVSGEEYTRTPRTEETP